MNNIYKEIKIGWRVKLRHRHLKFENNVSLIRASNVNGLIVHASEFPSKNLRKSQYR